MNTTAIIITILFGIFLGYCVGIYRGYKTYSPSNHEYDEGYLTGYNDAVKELTRESNAREVINQLDELFGEEDEEYAS